MKKIKHIISYFSSRIYLCIAAAVIVSLTVGVSLAYLAAHDNEPNTIIIDKGDTTISETWSEPTTLDEDAVQKVVQVHNNADTPCYVRVFVDFSDSEISKRALVSNDEAGTDNSKYITWDAFTSTASPQTIAPDWVYNSSDGYFYYTKPLAAQNDNNTDDDTTSLFRWVKTLYTKQSANGAANEQYLDTMGSEAYIKDFEIIVYSESVQTILTDGSVATDTDTENNQIKPAYKVAWENFLNKPNTTP